MDTSIPSSVNLKAVTICRQFIRFSYDLLGAYLDALAGLEVARQKIIRHQNEKIDKLRQTQPQNATMEFMDQQVVDHQLEASQQQPEELLHRSTQGEFKRRAASGGLDARFLGHMMVALLYGAWEDNYREKVALSLGHSKKNELKSELFQDINKLRQAIQHNSGKATKEVEMSRLRYKRIRRNP